MIYVPDFLINGGGIINCFLEYSGGWSEDRSKSMAENIYNQTLNIVETSEKENIHTQKAAMQIAQKRINDIAGVKRTI